MAGMITVCSKELTDHLGSKRYIILFALILSLSILLAHQGAEYVRHHPRLGFMAAFTGAQFGFSFTAIMVIFGPIIGLSLSFDSINRERASGTLSVILSQPIHRDSVINGKFLAGTIALSLLSTTTIGIMCGVTIYILGFGPTAEESIRIVIYTLFTILYLAFWHALGLLYSTVTKKTSTSMLISVTTWLFFSIIIAIVAALIAFLLVPARIPTVAEGNITQIIQSEEFKEAMRRRVQIQMNIQKLSPAYLYSEACNLILTSNPSGGFERPVRSLTLAESLLAIWPNITAIIAALIFCFVASYILFLRLEIRPER